MTSPTVSNDSIMAEIVNAAKERRKVASWDVVIVKFEGDSVDIMCQVNPAYEEFVEIKRGKGFVFFQLLKALYGCLRSALLWYNLYVSILKGLGFELNRYDQCVANKIINLIKQIRKTCEKNDNNQRGRTYIFRYEDKIFGGRYSEYRNEVTPRGSHQGLSRNFERKGDHPCRVRPVHS